METTVATSRLVTMLPSAEDMAAYHAAMISWKRENSKALGTITLRIASHLRHHLSEKTAYLAWQSLKQNFGDWSVSAYYLDFKVILATKLSGGNPILEMERLMTLLGRLEDTPIELTETLQVMILLAALPPKWDTIAQLFFQHTNLAQALTFVNIRKAIIQEYERHDRQTNHSANKLSAVKCKGPDPAHCQQQQQPRPQQQRTPQPQPGPSRQQPPQGEKIK
jgi:hypothetical protein